MPVGFVSAAESKAVFAGFTDVPWILTQGRKGGSTLVVATLLHCWRWPRHNRRCSAANRMTGLGPFATQRTAIRGSAR